MTVIDCHQHFWIFGKRAHKFPPAVGTRLDRDFTPEDLRPQLETAGVDGTILVQVAQRVDETCEFLDLCSAQIDLRRRRGRLGTAHRSGGLRAAHREHEDARQAGRHTATDRL